MSWDIKTLRTDIEQVFGPARLDEISPSLDAVSRRLRYAHFHYHEAFVYIDEVFNEDNSASQMIKRVLAPDMDEQTRRFQAEAHVLACIQNLHALPDTFAHVLYFGLDMNSAPDTQIEDRNINFYSVCSKLIKEPVFKEKMDSLKDGPDFKYLNDLVNRAKHRALVPFNYTVDMTSENKHGLTFSAFERGTRTHPKRLVREVLRSEHGRQSRLIVDTGIMLNTWVASKLTIA